MAMSGNAELLNFIYQNSQMGVDTIKQLIEITEDESFKTHLESDLGEYHDINVAAKVLLNANGYDEKGISLLMASAIITKLTLKYEIIIVMCYNM